MHGPSFCITSALFVEKVARTSLQTVQYFLRDFFFTASKQKLFAKSASFFPFPPGTLEGRRRKERKKKDESGWLVGWLLVRIIFHAMTFPSAGKGEKSKEGCCAPASLKRKTRRGSVQRRPTIQETKFIAKSHFSEQKCPIHLEDETN